MPISSSSLGSSALALTLVAGCGYGDCGEDVSTFTLAPAGPGSAALRVHGGTSSRRAFVLAWWSGTALHRGEEPCRLAVYEHASPPDPAQIPVLTRDDPAPTRAGEGRLVIETLLPGLRDGQAFVRRLDGEADTVHEGGEPYEIDLEPMDDEDLANIDVWLTFATCESPQIELELAVRCELCPARAPGAVTAELWWPAP